MGAKVEVVVAYPSGEPVVGAQVIGENRSATSESQKRWPATTGNDGSYTWENLDTGVLNLGDLWNFSAIFIDDEGVHWVGSASDRIKGPQTIQITLSPWYQGEVKLSDAAKATLGSSQEGRSVLQGIGELNRALKGGLFQSAVALSTYVLEGLFKMKLSVTNKWKSDYGSLTFGQLLIDKDVKEEIPGSLIDRLKALSALRIPNVHFKGSSSMRADAKFAATAVEELAKEWFG